MWFTILLLESWMSAWTGESCGRGEFARQPGPIPGKESPSHSHLTTVSRRNLSDGAPAIIKFLEDDTSSSKAFETMRKNQSCRRSLILMPSDASKHSVVPNKFVRVQVARFVLFTVVFKCTRQVLNGVAPVVVGFTATTFFDPHDTTLFWPFFSFFFFSSPVVLIIAVSTNITFLGYYLLFVVDSFSGILFITLVVRLLS